MRRKTVSSSWMWCLALVAACTFQGQNTATNDASTDAATLPIVGFASDSSSADHTSGTVMIPVVLTGDVTTPVSVSFRVAIQSTAVLGTDYTVTETTFTFTTAGTQNIPVTILPETTARLDGTIVLELIAAKNADLGTALHTINVSANVLPHVAFQLTTSQVTEGNTQVLVELDLDHLSNVPISVDFTVAGTASNPADYTIDATPITFAANEMSKQIVVTIAQDTLSEDDETAIITLTGASAATLGTNVVHTLTIHDDNDPEPDVSFTSAVESSPEATPTVTLTVQLSIPSGRTITVPFAANAASTATNPADYTYTTTSPLSFAPGQLSQTITLAVVNDTLDEADETVITDLQAPTNANLSLVNPTSNTLTIVDDDLACFGPAGAFQVCFDRGPTAPPATNPLPALVNTDTSGLCEPTQPPTWAAQGQAPACFIKGTTITVANTVVTGSRPLVLVASDTLTVTGSLDASSGRASGNVGPASPSSLCGTAGAGVQSSGNGGGGGAGGSFMSVGGNGGNGDNNNKNGGTAAAKDGANPTVLRAGCNGAQGGKDATNAGNAGLGGGAVYLIAGNTLVLGAAASINASGSGAAGGGNETGGSGAGSGGMIYLFGTAITTTATTKVFANGGGASGGGNNTTGGLPGGDPLGVNVATPALGGGGGGGGGGAGFAGAIPAGNGAGGTSNKAGGGGGGGGGFIESNVSLGAAKTSAGKIAVP